MVLLCEDLGGGEQRGLVAGVHGAQHGPQGDDGLAGADIPLQQRAGGVAVADALGDLLADLALAVREGEGEALVEQPLERPLGSEDRCRGAFVLGPTLGEDRLQHEGLLVAQVRHAALGVLEGEWGVDEAGGLGQQGQAAPEQSLVGHGAREGVGELEPLLGGGAHRGLRDVLAQRVHRPRSLCLDAALVGVLVGLVSGVGDLQLAAVVVAADGAVDHDVGADGEPAAVPLDLVRLGEEEGQGHVLDAVGDDHLEDEAAAAAHRAVAQRDHRDDSADLFTLVDLVQGPQRGGDDVATRCESHHGVQVPHPEGRHGLGLLRDQQLRQRHRAARGLLPPGHVGSSSSSVPYSAACEALSCHCPAVP